MLENNMNRKGILLAAGKGTRLHPMTLGVNKQLLPIYDKPMIFYPLSLFLHMGVRDVMIILDPEDVELFKKVLGSGERFGMRITYATQKEKNGIADAFLIAEDFIKDSKVCLILGDNILHGDNFHSLLKLAHETHHEGAHIFGYEVPDPERFGVVSFDENGKVLTLEEKPAKPQSKYAVIGIYLYDEHATKKTKTMKPSDRGELEITDLNKLYLDEGSLKVTTLPKGVTWFDTGTYDSLLEAALYVQHHQNNTTDSAIAHLEHIAFNNNFIDEEKAAQTAELFKKTAYGQHLKKAINKRKTV